MSSPRLAAAAGLLGLLVVLVLAGCSPERTYEVRGRVVGFSDDPRTVIVEHEDVPGLMPAMTMPFRAADARAVQALGHGDAVAFRLHVGRDSSWITDLVSLPDSAVAAHPAGGGAASGGEASPVLQPGDAVPGFTLVAASGDTLETAGFEGRAWLVTFIYTRCPLPDYCPLLSQRFQQLQAPLRARFGERVHLLSVSFDPAHDTPEVLRDYARRYGADPRRWTFATGSAETIRDMAGRFGVFYEEAGAEITHNLSTTLVGPDGRLRAVWRGNTWTTDDVLAAVAETLGEPAP